jgi:Cu/Ag efflux protein CusF
VVGSVVIPAEDVVAFTDEATHFRLVGLARALEEGGHFPMTLRFGDGTAIDLETVIGAETSAPDLVAQGEAKVNISHQPIPALGWPSMTMDLALLDGASAAGLAAGDAVAFELERGADGIYGIGAIWPAGAAPEAAEGAVRGTGTLNAIVVD